VSKVIDSLVRDFSAIDPPDASAFQDQKTTFETTTLAEYTRIITDIKVRYAGTPVGASESIFAMLAPALGLDLLTPPGFLKPASSKPSAKVPTRRPRTRRPSTTRSRSTRSRFTSTTCRTPPPTCRTK